MASRRRLALVAAAALALGGAGDDDPAAGSRRLRVLFPRQAAIEVEGGRLGRLLLPAEVLAACRPDLSDLRIFDAAGREVPFLVDAGRGPGVGLEVTRTAGLAIRGVDRTRTDRETGPPLYRERYALAVPAELPAGLRWDLEVVTSRPEFVKRVEVAVPAGAGGAAGGPGPRGEGGRGGGAGEATDRRPLVEGSLFRLDDPRRERTALPLPAFAAAELAVTLEGEDGGYLEPVFRLATGRSIAGRERAEVPLAEVARRRGEGRTEVELERPRGLVPDALRLAASTAAFHRPVEVWDEGPGRAEPPLGRRTLFRLQAPTAVEDLELPLAPARGDRLRVVIADGDSPPLDGLAFVAVARRPALLFALPATPGGEGGGAAAGTLRFGGGRAFRPRYDLATLAPALAPAAAGPAAAVAERLYDPALAAEARLGPLVANPDFDPAPALAFAHRPGAPLDPRRYRWRRPLAAEPSPEGLARLRLSPEDLAHARADLADLRLADGEGRQWAYLLERDAGEERAALAIEGPERDDGASRYRLLPPTRPATAVRVALTTDAPYFDRAFALTGAPAEDEGRDDLEIPLARGRLVRRAGDPRPVVFAFPPTRLDRLELAIDDGDDAPLAFTRGEIVLPLPAVYFAAPAGDYALLLGDPEADPPRYELTRVREVVLAVAAADARPGPLAANPDFSRRARLATAPGAQQVLLWAALGLAVVVLAALTLRLARRESG
jgi:hypothetical protein